MRKTFLAIMILLCQLYAYSLPLEYSFAREFGSKGKNDGRFEYPVCVTIDRYGSIYVTDWDNFRIAKFNREGKFTRNIELTPSQREKHGLKNTIKPIGIIATSADLLYVSDYNNHVLLIFDLMGELVKVSGGYGKDNGFFKYPRGIAADPDGFVFVADFNNFRVQKLDKDGKFVSEIRMLVDKKYLQPRSLAVANNGDLWVVFSAENLVARFDQKGKLLRKFGKKGSGGSEFNEPRYIALDVMENIYVSDYGNNRIQLFNSSCEYFGELCSKGDKPGFLNSPEGLWIDYNGNILIVDAKNCRIQELAAPPLTVHKYLGTHYENKGLVEDAFTEYASFLDISPGDDDLKEKFHRIGLALLNQEISSGMEDKARERLQTMCSFFTSDETLIALSAKLSTPVEEKVNKPEEAKSIPEKTSRTAARIAMVFIVLAIIALLFAVTRQSRSKSRKSRKKNDVTGDDEDYLSLINSDGEEKER